MIFYLHVSVQEKQYRRSGQKTLLFNMKGIIIIIIIIHRFMFFKDLHSAPQ